MNNQSDLDGIKELCECLISNKRYSLLDEILEYQTAKAWRTDIRILKAWICFTFFARTELKQRNHLIDKCKELYPKEYDLEHLKDNLVVKRLNQIQLECDKFSEAEIHHVANVLCYIRDTHDDHMRSQAEKLIHAFVTKKKLGEPVVFKKLQEEFGFK